MTVLPELFETTDIARLIFDYVFPAQQEQWFLQASCKNDWSFICFWLRVCPRSVTIRIKLKLFTCDCVDVLMMLRQKGYLQYSDFVSNTWQGLFAKASHPMRLFLWGIVPQNVLLNGLEMLYDEPNQFETFYGDLQPTNQCIVFRRVCEQGHAALVAKCLHIHITHDAWIDSVLIEFCNFFTISSLVLDMLLARGVKLFTIRTMRKHCFKNMDRVLNHHVSVVQVLCKYSIILKHENDFYFKRAVQLQRLDHVEFFWQPHLNTNLYMPSATCSNSTIEETDIYVGNNVVSHSHVNEFCPSQIQTKFDVVFQTLCSRTCIPRDLPLPNRSPCNFAQQMSSQIHNHYRDLTATDSLELFAKSCRCHILPIAQYLWITSDSKLKHLYTGSFVDARGGQNREFFEFLWNVSCESIVSGTRILAATAVRACNFVLWQFLFDHNLLSSDVLFDPTQSYIIASLCKSSSQFLKLVWNSDDKKWRDSYEMLMSAAIANKRRSIVCFLAKIDLPLSKNFIMEHRLYWFHHNVISMVRKIKCNCDELSSDLLYNLLIFAIENDWAELFEELLGFGTLTYDMIRHDFFKLFALACTSCSRAARILFKRFPMTIHDAAPFLNSAKCYEVFELLDEHNWDIDFGYEEQLPSLFLSSWS